MFWGQGVPRVLILVLMEDILRVRVELVWVSPNRVLILVLMEDILRVVSMEHLREKAKVLILVLMEDTLRATQKVQKIFYYLS